MPDPCKDDETAPAVNPLILKDAILAFLFITVSRIDCILSATNDADLTAKKHGIFLELQLLSPGLDPKLVDYFADTIRRFPTAQPSQGVTWMKNQLALLPSLRNDWSGHQHPTVAELGNLFK